MSTTDQRSPVIPDDGFGMWWSPSEGYNIVYPSRDDNEIVPPEGLALMAAMLRFTNDPEFVEDCLDWMHKQKGKAS